ncbi:MAG TPA: hypothetical protein VD994_13320 [Prosthecobacter sp.]|nr:hypothetical protein [Prosthecobacter sp.]
MNFPLTLRFKLLALASQIYVQDAAGRTICYVKQKMLRLREKVEVYSDDSRSQLMVTIEADRIIDWSARYSFKDPAGNVVGALGRRGMRSLWRAHYEVFAPGSSEPVFTIREENPFAKLLDGFLTEIPIVGLFTGYMLHPKFVAARLDGSPVARLTKQAAFLEGRFVLEKLADLNEGEESALVLSFLMLNLLERRRG